MALGGRDPFDELWNQVTGGTPDPDPFDSLWDDVTAPGPTRVAAARLPIDTSPFGVDLLGQEPEDAPPSLRIAGLPLPTPPARNTDPSPMAPPVRAVGLPSQPRRDLPLSALNQLLQPEPAVRADIVPEAAPVQPLAGVEGTWEVDKPSQFMQGLRTGFESGRSGVGETLETVGGLTGLEGIEARGEAMSEASRGKQEGYAGRVTDVRQIGSLGDFKDWAAFALGQGLGSTAAPIAGAAVGGAAGGPVGATVGALGPSYALILGEIRGEMERAGVDPSMVDKVAPLAAVPASALEALLPAALGRKAIAGTAAKFGKELAGKLARRSAQGMVVEGVTEAGQDAIAKGATAATSEQQFFTPETAWSLVNSALAGALPGAAFGAGGAVTEGRFGPGQTPEGEGSPAPLPRSPDPLAEPTFMRRGGRTEIEATGPDRTRVSLAPPTPQEVAAARERRVDATDTGAQTVDVMPEAAPESREEASAREEASIALADYLFGEVKDEQAGAEWSAIGQKIDARDPEALPLIQELAERFRGDEDVDTDAVRREFLDAVETSGPSIEKMVETLGAARRRREMRESATEFERGTEDYVLDPRPEPEPVLRSTTAEPEALSQEGGGPEVAGPEATVPPVGEARQMPVSEIRVAPERFQFKDNTDEQGVTRSLKGVKKWDPNSAGVVLVWRDPADGETYVVNGHHRVELADRLGVPDILTLSIEANDASEARVIGALANIREGRGTAVDAAKLFRDEGVTPADLEEQGVSLTEAVARDGLALANLHPTIFRDVSTGRLKEQRAAVIGASGLDQEQQLALYQMLKDREKSRKRRPTNDEVAELVRFVQGAGETEVTQESLFGEETLRQSNAVEKAEVSAYVRNKLAKDRRLFGFLTKGDRAAEIEQREAGRIEGARAEEIATQAGQFEEAYDKLSTMSGPVAKALNNAAARIARGEDRNEVKQEAYTEVQGALEAEIAGPQGADPESAPADAGRRGEAPEAAAVAGDALEIQGDLLGADEAVAGTEQRSLIGEDPETLDRQERVARQTVDRLRPIMEGGTPTEEQRAQYRDALALIRRNEGQSAEETALRAEDEPVTEEEQGGDLFAEPAPEPRPRDNPGGFLNLGAVVEGSKSVARRFFLARGELPKPVFDRKIGRDGWIKSTLLNADYTLADFDNAARAAYGTRRLNDEQLREVNAALQGATLDERPQADAEAAALEAARTERIEAEAAVREAEREGATEDPDVQVQREALEARAAEARTRFTTLRQEYNQAREARAKRAIEALPEPMRPVATEMRMQMDALSRRMIDSGVISGEMVAVVEDNLGVYLTRSYQIFDDPQWANKVPEDVRNKAKAMIRSEFPQYSDAQVDGLINELLFRGERDAPVGPVAALSKSGSKLGSKDLSILRRRKDIAPEIRALWGEFENPMVNYARSMEKMTRLIANHEFLSEVAREYTGEVVAGEAASDAAFFYDEPIVAPDGTSYHARFAAEGSETLAPLNGKYTTPEIKAAFERAMETSESLPWYLRHYMKANSAVKVNKTVLSPMTHVRNTISNIGFATVNGHYRIAKQGGAWATTLNHLRKKPDAERRAYYLRLAELGVVNQSVRAGELDDVINDAIKKGPDEFHDSMIQRGARKVSEVAGALYQAEDDVWKVFAFENEVQRYSEALGVPRAEVEERAAEIVRNTYPTYSMVPELVKKLRRLPIVGTFVSFPAEVVRVTYHSLRLTEMELADPQLRKIGAERLAGQVAAATGIWAAGMASRMILGMTADDDDDVRKFVAPWTENSNLYYLGRNEGGQFKFIDFSYTDPHAYFRTPLTAFLRGEDWRAKLWDPIKELSAPFLSEEILWGAWLDISRNEKKNGGRVYNPQAPIEDQIGDVMGHVWKAFEPGAISSGRRIYMGATGQSTHYGREYDLATEIIANASGLRIQDLDVGESLAFRIRDYQRQRDDAHRILTLVASRRNEVSEAEIREAYTESERSKRALLEQAHDHVAAAMRLGVPQQTVERILEGSGLTREQALDIIQNTYRPYQPSERFLESAAKSVESTVDEGDTGTVDASVFSDRRDLLSRLFEEAGGTTGAASLPSRPSRPDRPGRPRR